MGSFILWRGRSILDERPIALVGSRVRKHAKCGDRPHLQTRILFGDLAGGGPPGALPSVNGAACCPAECPFHPDNGGGCYARTGRPAMWSAHLAKTLLPTLKAGAVIPGEYVRLGGDGDPAAIPLDVLARILRHAGGWTGYTHAWRRPEIQPYRAVLMASVEAPDDAARARALGWRTFRVTREIEPPTRDEVVCPNVTRGATCMDCRLCDGAATAAKSITHPAHGAQVRRALEVVQ